MTGKRISASLLKTVDCLTKKDEKMFPQTKAKELGC